MKVNEVKEKNLALLRFFFRRKEITTKNELSKVTGLSVATCRVLIEEMILSGEAVEIENRPSQGGRPSRQFQYNYSYQKALCLYLRKERDELILYYGIFDLKGDVLEEQFKALSSINCLQLENTINDLISCYHGIIQVVMGIPGVIKDNCIEFCDVPSIASFNTNQIKAPITIVNDVNAMALGHHKDYRASSFAYVYYPNKGLPGAGIVVNHQVIQGSSFFAGEVSFLAHENRSTLEVEKRLLGTLIAIICVINPETIVLTGEEIHDAMLEDIIVVLKNKIPENHIPKIVIKDDIHQSYTKGLYELASQQKERVK